MCCLKNVWEECGAPDQIVLGTMGFRCCVLLAHGVYLETWYHATNLGSQKPLTFGSSDSPERRPRILHIMVCWATNSGNQLTLSPCQTILLALTVLNSHQHMLTKTAPQANDNVESWSLEKLDLVMPTWMSPCHTLMQRWHQFYVLVVHANMS